MPLRSLTTSDPDEVEDFRLPGRIEDFLVAAVVRPLMFVFWSLVFWGTFWCALFVWRVFSAGWATALRIATPSGHEAWGHANLGTALLALVVWSTVAALVLATRRRPRE